MNIEQKWTSFLGWKVSYYEPTYGRREFKCVGHFALKELNDSVKWLDEGGYMYTVTEIAK